MSRDALKGAGETCISYLDCLSSQCQNNRCTGQEVPLDASEQPETAEETAERQTPREQIERVRETTKESIPEPKPLCQRPGCVEKRYILGGPGTEQMPHMKVDAKGNVVIFGTFQGAMNLGKLLVEAVSGYDTFITKLSPKGEFLWAQRFGGSGKDESKGLALDKQGNIYITGNFVGEIGTRPKNLRSFNPNNIDVFLAKLNTKGSVLWAYAALGRGSNSPDAIAVDSQGGVYVLGAYDGVMQFGKSSLWGKAGYDVFLLKVNADGVFQWMKSYGAVGYQLGRSIALDSKDNVYIAGEFAGELSFGSFTLKPHAKNKAGGDLFLAKIQPDGKPLWAIAGGGVDNDIYPRVAVDKKDQVWWGGQCSNNASMGSFSLQNKDLNSIQICFAKVDKDGKILWAKTSVGPKFAELGGLSIDGQGRALITGSFVDSITFGETVLSGDNKMVNGFAVSLSDKGDWLWTLHLKSSDKNQGYRNTFDPVHEHWYMSVTFHGAIDFLFYPKSFPFNMLTPEKNNRQDILLLQLRSK